MKKVFFILILFLLFSGCSHIDTSEEKYYEMANKIINVENADTIHNLNIEIFKNDSDDDRFLYEIIVSDPKINFDDLKIIALPENYNFDELLPNFNVIEKVDISEFNKQNQNIKLNFFSQNNYQSFKIMIEYKKNDQEIQEVSNYKVKD